MKILRGAVASVLGILILVNGVLIVHWWSQDRAAWASARNAVVRDGTAVQAFRPLNVGFTPQGKLIDFTNGEPMPVAIRYAAKSCGYCDRDTLWPGFVSVLKAQGFRIAVMLPWQGERYDEGSLVPPDAVQLSFVPVDWLRQFRLTVTPTVLLFRADGRLLWSHEGVLRREPVDALLRQLRNRPAGEPDRKD